MTEIFADTGYWIALLSPRDELHSLAVQAYEMFQIKQIITSDLVLTELVNHFSASGLLLD